LETNAAHHLSRERRSRERELRTEMKSKKGVRRGRAGREGENKQRENCTSHLCFPLS